MQTMQTAIAFSAEFHRRLVAQRTVRPDSVVLAPPPSCFAAGIRHRLEFLAIQEFVTQATVKRLDEAILPRTCRRHVSWNRQSPDGEMKETSRWGWLFYRRVKTGKPFYRPMNRVVHAHIKSIMPGNPAPDEPVFLGGSARPNVWFQELCEIAGIKPRTNVETGKEEPWLLKDLRKTCATYYDAHIPESSIEILGHSVGGITYRHYAHRAPLAFKAIMTLPQPTAFMALVKGYDGECPCCRRPFANA